MLGLKASLAFISAPVILMIAHKYLTIEFYTEH